jgi:hypothetical protein
MSSVERAEIERIKRQAEYGFTLAAGLLGIFEQLIANAGKALASDEASAALRIARSAEARHAAVPAQRKGSR